MMSALTSAAGAGEVDMVLAGDKTRMEEVLNNVNEGAERLWSKGARLNTSIW